MTRSSTVTDEKPACCRSALLIVTFLTIVVPCSLLFSSGSRTIHIDFGSNSKTFDISESAVVDSETFLAAAEEQFGDVVHDSTREDDANSNAVQTVASLVTEHDGEDDIPVEARRPFDPPPGIEWTFLFNGKNLDGWEITEFGGEGPVEIENGELRLTLGQSLTGVTIDKEIEIPHINYEVQLEAMRVDGRDFFCGLTFPVRDAPCSLILGGWGGGVCGLSSIDFLDASENETTSYREFENGRWYHIRLRVQESRIDAWLDHKQIIKQRIVGRKISIRPEVHLSVPFGLASYETTAALKNIRIRPLGAGEIEAVE